MFAECGGDAGEGEEDEEHERKGQPDLDLSERKCPAALSNADKPPPHADGGGKSAAVVAGQALPRSPCALGGKNQSPYRKCPSRGREKSSKPAGL